MYIRLHYNYKPCEECTTPVVLMARIHYPNSRGKVKDVCMNLDVLPDRREPFNFLLVGTIFSPSHQCRQEDPDVSEGHLGCWEWWYPALDKSLVMLLLRGAVWWQKTACLALVLF